jgi:O-antigen ligase
LISILFASIYVRSYGVKASLNAIFIGCAVLCVADAVAALVAPEMVFGESEFGALRFRGDLIAQTGVVSVLAIVLLLTSHRRRSSVLTAAYIALFGAMVLLSLMRTSYLALIGFLLLALWKAPKIKLLKRVARWAILFLILAVLAGAVAHLEEYRAAETIWTLSDRVGLWYFIVDAMWSKSPWFGLGYYAASRVYGPDYNPELGTAHSVFVEVLGGGGILSFAILMVLFCVLGFYAIRLLRQPASPISFSALGLLLVTSCFLAIGSELEADPAGFTLWVLAAAIPLLCSTTARHLPKLFAAHGVNEPDNPSLSLG